MSFDDRGARMLMRCLRTCTAVGFLVPIAAGAATAVQSGTQRLTQPEIRKLVRNASWNEVHANAHPHHRYLYIDRISSSEGYRTREEISTAFGTVDRLLRVNGEPPSSQQRRKNQKFLLKLAHSPGLQSSRLKEQDTEISRRNTLLSALPQAFLYTFIEKDQRGWVHLRFKPNPSFRSHTREGEILQGMAGELWIDSSSQRIAKVQGVLIQAVSFGWGFLARLNPGGHFLIEQKQTPEGDWYQSYLSVKLDGKEMMVKGLHVHVTETRCCLSPIPDGTTIAEAVNMALKAQLPENWDSQLKAAVESAENN